jgi:hypothetical protein
MRSAALIAILIPLVSCGHVDDGVRGSYSISGFPGPILCLPAGSHPAAWAGCMPALEPELEDGLISLLRRNQLVGKVTIDVRLVDFANAPRPRLTFDCKIYSVTQGPIANFRHRYEFDYGPAPRNSMPPSVPAVDALLADIATVLRNQPAI